MGVKLVSASAGSVEIVAPTTASNYTATLPAGTGTMVVNGINGSIVSGSATASTSGTSIDFTSIPFWVKRIIVMFGGVSTNGASDYLVQIGAGSVAATGYLGTSGRLTTGVVMVNYTTGFGINNGAAAASYTCHGSMTLTLLNSATGLWCASGVVGNSASNDTTVTGASKTLSGTLDRVRITTVNGTDTFDAGSVNILYE
jgi:chitodextrinase